MTKVKRKRISEMKTIATEEEIHELEKLFALGLKLELEAARRKNPYFKGSRQGPEHKKRSREERRAAVRFSRCFVKSYFIVQRSYDWLVSPN